MPDLFLIYYSSDFMLFCNDSRKKVKFQSA
nr:MAG TPA: hypothetical protein [Caudoviricetes sp.]